MIRSNCPESYHEFLNSYFFNLQKCLFRIFPTVTSESILKKRPTLSLVFVNMNSVFLLAACTNSLADSSPNNYMSCLGSLIWLNRIWGSWYLIIWLDSYFFKLTLDNTLRNFVSWTLFRFQNHPDSAILQK